MSDWYKPRTVWEVRQWLVNRFPNERSRYLRMQRKQLFAVYNSVNKQIRVKMAERKELCVN